LKIDAGLVNLPCPEHDFSEIGGRSYATAHPAATLRPAFIASERRFREGAADLRDFMSARREAR
jgi:hypothetical protein